MSAKESWQLKMENYKSGEMGELEDITVNFEPRSNHYTVEKTNLNQSMDLNSTGKFPKYPNFKDVGNLDLSVQNILQENDSR
jgi:hypothetical protein